ncbi:MAG: hypothetical protein PHQ69_05220, partial [Bacteroidales bacterium]|nr:hypothetical protein [Bacteroidales bacterium]
SSNIPPQKPSIRSRTVSPVSTSKNPGYFTLPETVNIFVPGDFYAPSARNQAAPFITIAG